jgi:hypothetical protein
MRDGRLRRFVETVMRRFAALPNLAIVIVALVAAPACGGEDAAPPAGEVPVDEAAYAARGAEMLAPFKLALMAALSEGLEQGPEEALHVCQVRAPELADEASGAGVRVGRTSHRVRNPANAPEPWMQPLLDAYLAEPEEAGPRVVALGGGRVGYVEPIFVQPMCLTCHGDVLAPDVVLRIAELYPEDEAVGFAPGDLRGLFWVLFEAGDAGSGEGSASPEARSSTRSPAIAALQEARGARAIGGGAR